MTKQTLLFLALLLSACGYGQTELQFNISTKHQPTNWRIYSPDFQIGRDAYVFWPVLQAELGTRTFVNRSNWFFEAAVSFRHTREVYDFSSGNFPGEIDPFYGFVHDQWEPSEASASNHLNYAGVKIGGGYRLSSQNQKHALLLPLGLQCHVPAGSKSVSNLSGSEKTYRMYRGDEFKWGIYYGLYFKPSWEFSLSGKRSNPWRFSVYAEGDALIHHTSEVNPKFLWGGGLGVNYRLGERF